MFRNIVLVIAVVTSILAAANSAQAVQYQRGSHVVHTRMAPVVVHRVFPPYTGIHVYQGGPRDQPNYVGR